MDSVLSYIDRLFPREVIIPIVVAFSAENIISAIFNEFVPKQVALVAWAVIFVGVVVAGTAWEDADGDENFD